MFTVADLMLKINSYTLAHTAQGITYSQCLTQKYIQLGSFTSPCLEIFEVCRHFPCYEIEVDH